MRAEMTFAIILIISYFLYELVSEYISYLKSKPMRKYKWKKFPNFQRVQSFKNEDIWRMVFFVDHLNNLNKWKLKSFNNETKTARVVYTCNNDWENYDKYTWVSTQYEDLTL